MAALDNTNYQLLDSGESWKLEQIGPYRLIRPALGAIWPKSLPLREWDLSLGRYIRDSSGSGAWNWNGKVPDSWQVRWGDLNLLVKPTNFGHLGFFAEQREQWDWLRQQVSEMHGEVNTLNLFAYSGGASLAMAGAGAKVCHVDAAKGMIAWGRENLTLNPEIPSTVRWIVDDVFKFVNREIRRERKYQGIVLDPPSFGRGNQGQIWKMEDNIIELLNLCIKLLDRSKPNFMLFSCHTPGFSPLVLSRLLRQVCPNINKVEAGEMTVPESSGKKLPAGAYARFFQG